MNKLNIGDIIELKTRTVRHFVKNLGLLYVKPESGEFVTGYASEVAMFLGAYLKTAGNPQGKVVSYGARLDGTGDRYVMVKVSNDFGKTDAIPVLEQDVVLVKRKK